MSLTDKAVKRTWLSVWKYISVEAAEVIGPGPTLSAARLDSGALSEAGRGYDDLGFSGR